MTTNDVDEGLIEEDEIGETGVILTLPRLDGELEKVWIELKRDQRRQRELHKNFKLSVSMLSISIILLSISVLIVIGITYDMEKKKVDNG